MFLISIQQGEGNNVLKQKIFVKPARVLKVRYKTYFSTEHPGYVGKKNIMIDPNLTKYFL